MYNCLIMIYTKELDKDYFWKFLIHISCLKSDWFYIIHVSYGPDFTYAD